MKYRVVFIFFVVLLVSGTGCYFFQKEHSSDTINLYGNVDVRQVDIGFRVQGRVDKLFFEEGDLVSKGTLIATIDKTPYDSKVEEAAAKVKSTKAQLELAEILLRRRLEVVSSGGVSLEAVDQARSDRDSLKAILQENKAALVVALDDLSYTEVFSPTDCVILTRIREPGTVVQPSDPVYTLSVISPVWVRAFIDEPQLGEIYYGMEAEVSTDTPKGKTYVGQIGFISPVAEFTPKTVQTTQLRTDLVYRLRIYVNNPDKYLKQGMPVTVKLRGKGTRNESNTG